MPNLKKEYDIPIQSINNRDLYGTNDIPSCMYDITSRNILIGVRAHCNGNAIVGRLSIMSNTEFESGPDGGVGTEYIK